MEFALTDRCQALREQLLAFMDEHVYPAEQVYHEQIAESGQPHFHPPVMEELKGLRARSGALEPVAPPRHRGSLVARPDQRRVRVPGRDHGPQPHRARGVQLRGARHGQHGGSDPVRHARAEGPVAGAVARGRDPFGVRDDRAGGRELRRDQHRAADRARRRRLRAQRPQVVDLRRAARALQGDDRDGQDGPRRSYLSPAIDDPRPAGDPGRHDHPKPPGVRVRRPGGARRGRVRRRACPGHRTWSPTRATGS